MTFELREPAESMASASVPLRCQAEEDREDGRVGCHFFELERRGLNVRVLDAALRHVVEGLGMLRVKVRTRGARV